MEPLSRDDPRRIGPYHLIARLDPGEGDAAAAARCFVARNGGGDRTVLLSAPPLASADDTGYRERFRAEAESALLLAGASRCRWIVPVAEVTGDGTRVGNGTRPGDGTRAGGGTEPPWSASPYLPMLPLPAALEAHGGPLPLRTVRALGAALAEALDQVHEAGFTHAGVAPGTVFLAGDGPRLAGFGAVRAAGPDGAARTGLPGLDADALPPEQLAGGRPRPLGDVFALGSVLAYAATGQHRPEADALPPELRDTLRSCLAPDPADRPTARALLDELMRGVRAPLPAASAARTPAGVMPSVVDGASGGPSATHGGGPGATALDAGISRAAGLLGPGWLPGRLIIALSEQSSTVLAAEIEPDPVPEAEAGTAAGALSAEVAEAFGGTAAGTSVSPEVLSPSRRSLLVGAAGGAAGLAVGGGVTWAVTEPDPPAPPTPAQRLAAARPSRRRTEGAPPTPAWRYDIEGAAPVYAPLIWRDAVAVITGERFVAGIDLRTGKRLWTQDGLRPKGQPWAGGGDALFVPGDGIAALEPRTGRIRWQSKEFRRGTPTSFAGLLAVDGTTVWFTAEARGGTAETGGRVVVAYDIGQRHELWRARLPGGFSEGRLLRDAFVLRGARKGAQQALAFGRTTGKKLWQRVYPGVGAEGLVTTDGDHTLIAAVGATLRGFEATEGAKGLWSVASVGEGAEGHRADFGLPFVRGRTAYAGDGGYALHAIEAATGRIRWQRTYGFGTQGVPARRIPEPVVTPEGHRILMAGSLGVNAFDTEDGALLWRFTDVSPAREPESTRRKVTATDDHAVVIGHKSVYALPLD
ncbi:PQQ-binding-like beta-propeller repeat protein [Streptomyces sp. Rer75]|uniref:outer membrane protein assembly factor BamB family protein n=1 Tax=unclassified Streptomyces TaxID=2593676 RepID=UPI0015D00127|nr:PQQ-binding-like beta-propeller repeat protein [Streptomyces sp. Rer75]QLH24484.1 PQQ-binding-like beta-propeller repeat protein [Streptomyces sp. Rer75]